MAVKRLQLMLVFLLVALLITSTTSIVSAESSFTIGVSPLKGAKGTLVTVTSSSAPVSSPVNIVVGSKSGSDGQVVATAKSDSQGRFRVSFRIGQAGGIKPGTIVGIWAVAKPWSASKVKSNIRAFAVSFAITASPSSGPAKTRVAVSSTEAPPDSSVTIFVGDTKGDQGTAMATAKADSRGRFQASFVIGDAGGLTPGTDIGVFARAAVSGSGSIPSTVPVFHLTRVVKRPSLQKLSPGPFTTVGAGWHQIGATASSDAAIAEVALWLNGELVSSSLNGQSGDRVDVFVSRHLAPGTYTATLQVTDREGDRSTAQWDFTVGAAGESQWFTSNGALKTAEFNATVRSLVEAYRYHLYGQSWDGTRHPGLPTHVSTISNADPLGMWTQSDGSLDRRYTEATMRSLVEAFRWHLFGKSWEPGYRPAMVTHATSYAGPDSLQPWFDSAGRPIRGNMEATLVSLVQAMRWHFWGYTWDGVRHPDLPAHGQ